MSEAEFGNEASKTERYRAFWSREGVERPLVGFTLRGWFPLQEYAASRSWAPDTWLTPDMVVPEHFLDDEESLIREGEVIDDDLIRGSSPAAAVIPWLSAMMGSRLRVLPGSVLGEEQTLSWEKLERIELDDGNPWFTKYVEFAQALAGRARGRFPVSHGALIGPSDLMGLLRGHTQSIVDLFEEPRRSSDLLWRFAEIFREVTQELWKRLPLYQGGYFDGMYQLWSPGPIIRMQEDATGVYSPRLYREFLQEIDRYLAGEFACSFIHLHSTSMFLLDAFLEVEQVGCFEINRDALGPPIGEMIPYFRMVQSADRPLLIRGTFAPDEIRLLMDSLETRGLFLLVMSRTLEEIESLRPLVGL